MPSSRFLAHAGQPGGRTGAAGASPGRIMFRCGLPDPVADVMMRPGRRMGRGSRADAMTRGLATVIVASAILAATACGNRVIGKQFEYEEEIVLAIDGSATVVVNASVPALVALRGLPLDPNPRARLDRNVVRALFEGPGVNVTRVSRPWRRHGRRFVQVRLEAGDVRTLSALAPFAWSEYRLDRQDGLHVYRQVVGAPDGTTPAGVNWTGSELIGIRLHLPSRIVYHNAPSKSIDRGNILSWEQPLRERLEGRPIEVEVRMETQSILYRTLTVFGLAAAAALLLLTAAIFWVWRRGRAAQLTAPGSRDAA